MSSRALEDLLLGIAEPSAPEGVWPFPPAPYPIPFGRASHKVVKERIANERERWRNYFADFQLVHTRRAPVRHYLEYAGFMLRTYAQLVAGYDRGPTMSERAPTGALRVGESPETPRKHW